MAEVVGTAVIELTTDASKVSAGATKAGEQAGTAAASGTKKTFGSSLKNLWSTIGPAISVAAAVGVVKSAIGEAEEANKVAATTRATLKATKGASGETEASISALANSISQKAGMDDEMIQSGENVLLTFKKIRNEAGQGNDAFNRATQAAVDLSAAGFGSVRSASTMLGKALNDPVKGVSALARVGVGLTEQQKKQVEQMTKTGDTLGAQKIILKAVEGQVGGVAAASATATDKMGVAWGNFMEVLGGALLPIIGVIAGVMMTVVIPALSALIGVIQQVVDWIVRFKDIILIVIGALGLFLGPLLLINAALLVYQGIMAVVSAVTAAYNLVVGIARAATLAWQVAVWLLNAAWAASPIGVIVVILLVLAGLFVLLWKRSETFRNIVKGAWAAIKAAVASVVNWFKGPLATFFTKTLPQFFRDAWDKAKDIFKTAVKVLLVIMFPFPALALAIWRRWGDRIKEFIRGAWDRVKDLFRNALAALRGIAQNIVTAVSNTFSAIVGHLRSSATNAVNAVRSALGRLPGVVSSIASSALSAGKKIGGNIISGVRSGLSAAGGLVSSLASSIKSAVNSALGLPANIGFSIAGKHFGATIPALARGTSNFAGGLALVGERGPELVALPRGTAVLTAAQTRAALGSPGPTINVYLPTGDPQAAALAVANRLAVL